MIYGPQLLDLFDENMYIEIDESLTVNELK